MSMPSTKNEISEKPMLWNLDYEAILNRAAALSFDFRRSLTSRPYRPKKNFAEMREVFRAPLPENSRDGTGVIEELAALVEPGLGAMAGARFFGWVMGASHPVGVAADWIVSAWGQSGGDIPAPGAAACEEAAAGWLLELLHLPAGCSVGFATGATVASFVCLAAARGEVLRRFDWDVEAKGLFGAPPIHVVIGDEAHASVFSALQYLGLGHDRVTRVPTDSMGRMRVAEFARAIRADDGPKIAIAQAGQINTGAFDPMDELAPIAHEHGAWIHVDGAFGLWARACPEKAHLAAGFEAADSWATNVINGCRRPLIVATRLFAMRRHTAEP
jgi:glutamate/tyrosine decarboxylase-like PLP-dependent enzyme